jgi:hypothetical protein
MKVTLSSFQKDKSPGLDGWTIEFFLGFLDFIGKYLLAMVEESRRTCHIYAPFNSTFIALIPKAINPSYFDDFCPIFLYNCIYKIVVKVIAKRIKDILSESISKEQFQFLEGRQIHEAIGVSQ